MADIESKKIEANISWWSAEKTDYSKILWKENDIGNKQTEEEHKQAADILKQLQWTTWEAIKKTANVMYQNTKWWFAQQWKEFIQNNPDKKDRVPAGENIPTALKEDQKGNILGKAFQWISKRLLWKDNF
jgi:hypothetical protein